jgi:hypothetical protein
VAHALAAHVRGCWLVLLHLSDFYVLLQVLWLLAVQLHTPVTTVHLHLEKCICTWWHVYVQFQHRSERCGWASNAVAVRFANVVSDVSIL